MNSLLEEIQSRARQLSPEERADLALNLIQSVDADKTKKAPDWEAVWLAECDRRLQRYEAGEDQGVTLEAVFDRVRSKLR